MLKGKAKKEKPFFNFIEKRFADSQPTDSLVITTGAGGQAPMILGRAKGKNKMRSCYLYGKKGLIVKNCW